MVITSHLGVIRPETLKRARPYFLVAALVVAAVITPPDPFTMLLVGIPLALLYEIGLLLSALVKGSEAPMTKT